MTETTSSLLQPSAMATAPTTELPAEAALLLREWLGDDWSVRPLAGDASVRAYYRVARPDGTTFVLAWYPLEVRAELRRFLDAHEAVVAHARVPGVVKHSVAAVLQSDIGDRTLFDILHQDRDEGVRLYRDAIELLVDFQRAGDAVAVNPPFSAEFFANELAMTREFYVEKLMAAPAGTGERLEPLFQKLAENIASHPYVLCHRDFHGQNIHLFNGQLFVIDFQDMRMGPDTYDLASLLRDRGVARFLGDDEERLVEHYRSLRGAGPELRHRYFETLLQRSLKILGTFSRQPIDRGKMHYLEFIPATLDSVRRCLEELPEFAPIAELLPATFSLEAAQRRVNALRSIK